MLCDFCKEREAVIFLEQMSGNGQKRKINMCGECAIDRGISSDPRSIEASIGDLFKELANLSRKAQRESRRMCPVCGVSVGDIRRKGLVGCPECYSIFKDDIRKYIMGKGIKGIYTGSMPERLANMRSVLNDRMALQDKLSTRSTRRLLCTATICVHWRMFLLLTAGRKNEFRFDRRQPGNLVC